MVQLRKLSVEFRTTSFGFHARTCLGISRFAQEIGKTNSVEFITGIGDRVNAKDLGALLRLGNSWGMTFRIETDAPEDLVQKTEKMIRDRVNEILTSC